MAGMPESQWETFVLEELAELAWEPKTGKEIAKGSGERESWSELIIPSRRRDAIARINSGLPLSAVDDAAKIVLSVTSRDARAENRRMHKFMTEGIGRSSTPTSSAPSTTPRSGCSPARRREERLHGRASGATRGRRVPPAVRRCAVLQRDAGRILRAEEGREHDGDGLRRRTRSCRPTCTSSRWRSAARSPSSPTGSRASTAPRSRRSPLRALERRRRRQPVEQPAVEVVDQPVTAAVARGLRSRPVPAAAAGYVAFDEAPTGWPSGSPSPISTSRSTKAVGTTVRRCASNGKAGVVWHTQGSGKSMEMELYANRVIRHPSCSTRRSWSSPTAPSSTASCSTTFEASQLLPEEPKQIRSRAELRDELTEPHHRRDLLHHPAEVRPQQGRAGVGRRPSAAVGPAQHRRDRRRGPPQPLRRPGRLRPPPAGRAAARHAHRVHRHPDLASPTATPARCSATTSTSTT